MMRFFGQVAIVLLCFGALRMIYQRNYYKVAHFFGQAVVVLLCIVALQKNYPDAHYTQRWIFDFLVPTLVVLLTGNMIYFFGKRIDCTKKPILKKCVRISLLLFYLIVAGWWFMGLIWFGPM